jgi:polyhydroxyalkanoate synthesis repressor PhaR
MQAQDKTLILKKYSSRRLYNPETSAYITLNQVADLIRTGTTIKVLDAKTGADVTALILTQIILEEAKSRDALLPAPVLHLMIRYGNTILQEFFERHLQDAINAYLQYKQVFDQQYRTWLNMGMNYGEMTGKAMRDMAALSKGMFATPPASQTNPPPKKKRRR